MMEHAPLIMYTDAFICMDKGHMDIMLLWLPYDFFIIYDIIIFQIWHIFSSTI